MDIKEIALKVASELDFSGPIAISPLPDHLYIDFAEALIAEIVNETAKAIADYCSNQGHYCLSAEIESGAWKDFKK